MAAGLRLARAQKISQPGKFTPAYGIGRFRVALIAETGQLASGHIREEIRGETVIFRVCLVRAMRF